MSNTAITIQLFDESSIGRYYQFAALAAIYDVLDIDLARKVKSGVESGRIVLTLNDLRALLDALVDYLKNEVCQVKDRVYGPTLYRAGVNDYRILRSAGLIADEKERLTCSSLVERYEKDKDHLLQRASNIVEVPMYLRAYVFSKYRSMSEVKHEAINVISLYLATAGVYVSMIGRIVKGEDRYELYLNPEVSVGALQVASRMYSLLNQPRSKVRLPIIIQSIINLEGISLELASIFSIAYYVYHVAKHVLNMQSLAEYYNVFEKLKLVCIKPEQRPLVIWERPLTLTHIIANLESVNALDLLAALESLTEYAVDLREKVSGFTDSVSACINDLYAYIETKVLDAPVHCASGLARIFDALDENCRKGDERTCNAKKNVNMFIHYIARLVP